jgi:hypothetical protein
MLNTEAYNGSSWTEVADLSQQQDNRGMGAGSTNADAICATGLHWNCKKCSDRRMVNNSYSITTFKTNLKDNYILIQQQTLLKKR